MGTIKRALVADSHSLFRAGLVALAERKLKVGQVAGVGDLGGAMAILRGWGATCLILLDTELPDLHGAEGVREIVANFPTAKVVMVAGARTTLGASDALAAGARGYVLKDRADEQIAADLRAVLAGQIRVSEGERKVAAVARVPANDAGPGLTQRQGDVLGLLADGKSNKEIGRALGICEGTVKVHLLAAFRQLGVRNRVEAALVLRGPYGQHLLPGFTDARRVGVAW